MEHKVRRAFKRQRRPSRPAPSLPQQWAVNLLRAFLWGTGTALLLLAGGAAAFAAFPIPSILVRPAACLIAGTAAAVSGLTLARQTGHCRLLCGLGCGIFYALCLICASAVSGELVWDEAAFALLGVLACSGMLGGTIAALRPVRRGG